MPPITTVARGRCTSAPADDEKAIGRNPKISVVAVNIIGRIRSLVPVKILSFILVTPSSFKELNLLISTSPFKTATPNNTMKPTPAEILNGISLNQRANIPPIAASGMAI